MKFMFSPSQRVAFNEQIINNMINSISDTVALRSLLLSIVINISKTMGLVNASYYLYEDEYEEFTLLESVGFQSKKIKPSLHKENALVQYFKKREDFLIQTNIKAQMLKLSKQTNHKKANMDLLNILSMELDELKGEVAVPFYNDNKIIGILILGKKNDGKQFDKHEFILLKQVAERFVPLITGAKLYEDSKQRERELSALYEVGKVINASFELTKTIDIICSNASILLRVPKVIIILSDAGASGNFEIKKSMGFTEYQIEQIKNSQNFKQCTQLLLNDVTPRLFKTIDLDIYQEFNLIKELNINSMMSIPLYNEDLEVIGELRAMRPIGQKPFTERELNIGINLANNVTIALKNANLYQRSEDQLVELAKVYNITKAITSEFDITKIENKLCHIFVSELNFEKAILYLYQDKEQFLYPVACNSMDCHLYEGLELGISSSIEGRSLVESRMITVNNAQSDPRVDKKVTNLLNLKKFIVLPLITKNKPVGVVVAEFEDSQIVNEPLLSSIANQAAIALESSLLYQESAKLNEQLKKEKIRTEKELEMASYVQQSMLSSKLPDTKFLAIEALNIPCRAVGGDFYNFIKRDEYSLGVAIGDVSGKGIPAALLMNLTSGIFSELGKRYKSPEQILSQANLTLLNYFKASPLFYVTAFYGVFDFLNNLFWYSKAGHNPPLLYRKQKDDVVYLDTEGVYLGPFEEGGFIEKKIQVCNGDKLVLYTDGVTEMRKTGVGLFTKERLLQVVKANKHLGAQDLHSKIIHEVTVFNDYGEAADDLTLVVLELKNMPKIEEEKIYNISYKIPSKMIEVKKIVKDFLKNLSALDLPSRTFNHLRLAFSEALLNSCEHGNKNDPQKTITVSGTVTNYKIELTIEDQGKGFNPGKKDLSENQLENNARGRGLAVIKGFMDEMIYNNQGNKLTLIKYF